MTASRIDRVLLAHPDLEVRTALEALLRKVHRRPVVVRQVAGIGEATHAAREQDPHLVFLDLGGERSLALAVARELRRSDRLVVGLYNPLLEGTLGAEFFRRAARAGVGDYLPVPVPEGELAETLAAAPVPGAARTEGRLVTFFGHQGGIGTTTLALNSALVLAGSGAVERVAICDAAVQFGSVATHLGLLPDRDLSHAVRELGEGSVTGFLLTEPDTGLRVLASPVDPRDAEGLEPAELSRLLVDLRHRFDLTVVDTAPVLDRMTLAALDLADTVVVVTEGSTPVVAGTARLLRMLADLGFAEERVKVVLNRHRPSEGFLPPGLVAEQIGHPVARTLPHHPTVPLATHRGVPPVFERQPSPFMEAVATLADDLDHWTTRATSEAGLLV